MTRKFFNKKIVLLFVLTLLLPSISFADSKESEDIPEFEEAAVHDPSVIKVDDTYYVFGSHLAAAKTTDFMKWEQISDGVNPDNPLFENVTQELEEAFEWAEGEVLWAPDVAQLDDGRFYMYYNAAEGSSPRSALGVAVADDIEGPYKDEGIFLKSGMWDEESENPDETYDPNVHPNAIDPHTFYDAEGKLWMVYGSYSGGIFILEMDSETGFPIEGQGYGTKLMGGNHSRIEAPYIQYVPETGYYYLYTTFGGLAADGGYNMRVVRSENPDGPYVDAEGNDMIDVKGKKGADFDDDDLIEPYGVKLFGNYMFERQIGEPGEGTGVGYISPGHNSVYYDEETGEQLLIFHSRFPERGEAHEIRVHQMFMNKEGWPVVAPYRYAEESLENVAETDVIGDYKFINHGKEITDEIKKSAMITLEEDGTLSGAEGTWELNGDQNAVIEMDGSIYEGVFLEQWDPVSEQQVMTFTALSDGGVSVWGSQMADQSDADIVQNVINDLDIGQTEVVNDLVLPTEGAQGTEITWESSQPEVISEQGVVDRSQIGEDSITVKLTATVSKQGETEEKTFEVTVLPSRDEGLVAHYPFDGDLSDVSENYSDDEIEIVGSTIEETGGDITYEEGQHDQAAKFDGQSGIKLPDGLISSDAYTVSVWLKPDELTEHTPTFFGAQDENHWVSLVPLGEKGETLVWSGSASWYDETPGIEVETGEWSHVAFTVQDGELNVYLNGEPEFSGPDFPDIFTTSDGTFALGVNYWDEPYQGLMDDLLIYEGALTDDEIDDYFETGVVPGEETDTDPEQDPKPDPEPEPEIDTDELEDLIEDAQDISNDDGKYTEDSFAALEEAIEKATEALDGLESKEDVDEWISILNEAIDGLEDWQPETGKDDETAVDTEALEALIAKAIEKVEQVETYTKQSIQQLEAAILEAETVIQDASTQDAIDQAVADLQQALDDLETTASENNDGDDEEGKELPKTATTMFTTLLIGFVLLSLGGLFLLLKRKKATK